MRLFFCAILFVASCPLWAQDTLAVSPPPPDTLKKPFLHFLRNENPDPKTALRLSLVLPGAGQAYNGKWWKLPFVYGALGGMVYLIDYNTEGYLLYKTAYRRQLRGLPHDFTGLGFLDNTSLLKDRRDSFDKNRQLSYIGFVAVYALVGIEAFVDAHLASFDVSDDLSFRLKPSLTPTPYDMPALGIGIAIRPLP